MVRKDLTRIELVEAMEHKVLTITYDTPTGRVTVAATLQESEIARLDNYPRGFESTREAALYDYHAVNALDIIRNQWVTIPIGNILDLKIP